MESRMTAMAGAGRLGGRGMDKKEKALVDTDNSGDCSGEGGKGGWMVMEKIQYKIKKKQKSYSDIMLIRNQRSMNKLWIVTEGEAMFVIQLNRLCWQENIL